MLAFVRRSPDELFSLSGEGSGEVGDGKKGGSLVLERMEVVLVDGRGGVAVEEKGFDEVKVDMASDVVKSGIQQHRRS
jgi:hypothetical protein